MADERLRRDGHVPPEQQPLPLTIPVFLNRMLDGRISVDAPILEFGIKTTHPDPVGLFERIIQLEQRDMLARTPEPGDYPRRLLYEARQRQALEAAKPGPKPGEEDTRYKAPVLESVDRREPQPSQTSGCTV